MILGKGKLATGLPMNGLRYARRHPGSHKADERRETIYNAPVWAEEDGLITLQLKIQPQIKTSRTNTHKGIWLTPTVRRLYGLEPLYCSSMAMVWQQTSLVMTSFGLLENALWSTSEHIVCRCCNINAPLKHDQLRQLSYVLYAAELGELQFLKAIMLRSILHSWVTSTVRQWRK